MRQPSVKRTLLLRCGIGVGALLCLLSAGIYLIVRHGLYRELDRSISQTAALLSNQVELEDGGITFEWKEGVGTNRALRDSGLFQFWNETTGNTTRSARLNGMDLPKFCGDDGTPLIQEIILPGNGRRARAIGMRIYPFVLPEEKERMMETGRIIDPKSLPHILVIARDMVPMYRVLNRARWVLGTGTLLTLALVFLVIHQAIRVTLRPIDELALQMKDRTAHQLDSALDVPLGMPVELAGLAESFDSLLARVAAMRERERDFIRHAAHELRTPIAGLRATTDLALSQPREAAAYAAHLATCQKTAAELGELVKRLSALSRIGQETARLTIVPVDTCAILTECLKTFQSQFDERGLQVKRDFPDAPVIVSGDTTLLKIIFNNLLDNAVSYAPRGSEIHIHSGRCGGLEEIRIANPSDDLPENLERLFEPLFRRDASRNASEAHLGIGLTLSLEAASALGANLYARKTDAGWIEFVLGIKTTVQTG